MLSVISKARIMKSQLRILVAEDNAAMGHVLQFNLQKAGFEAQVADSGGAAWDLLCRQQFDLVITDHQMPGMTGLELCQAIRSSPALRATPVILLTAKGLELELARLTEEFGLAAAFSKPFSPSALVRAVRKTLSATESLAAEPSASTAS
jgi:CheY-like chemotaxis protein